MESNGVGRHDDDDPPAESRLSRLPQPATKRIAAAAVVVLVAGGGFWAAHRASHSGPKVGDCAIDSTTDIDRPAIRKAACTDPVAVYQVAAKTTAVGDCPAGDYSKLTSFGSNNVYNLDHGTSLCLALHVRAGECLEISGDFSRPTEGVIVPRVIDCAIGPGAGRFRITAIRTDTIARSACPKTALQFSYSTPREVICASGLA